MEVPIVTTVEKIVEVPIVKRVQKFVEVPQIQYIDKVVDVPKITTVEKIIEIPRASHLEETESPEQVIEHVDLGVLERKVAPTEHEEIREAGEEIPPTVRSVYHAWDSSSAVDQLGMHGMQAPLPSLGMLNVTSSAFLKTEEAARSSSSSSKYASAASGSSEAENSKSVSAELQAEAGGGGFGGVSTTRRNTLGGWGLGNRLGSSVVYPTGSFGGFGAGSFGQPPSLLQMGSARGFAPGPAVFNFGAPAERKEDDSSRQIESL